MTCCSASGAVALLRDCFKVGLVAGQGNFKAKHSVPPAWSTRADPTIRQPRAALVVAAKLAQGAQRELSCSGNQLPADAASPTNFRVLSREVGS